MSGNFFAPKSLCPHQDYVYFNYPTKEEEKEVRRFEERSKAMTEKIMRDTQFLTYVRSHKGFSGQLSDDLLLDNPDADRGFPLLRAPVS